MFFTFFFPLEQEREIGKNKVLPKKLSLACYEKHLEVHRIKLNFLKLFALILDADEP